MSESEPKIEIDFKTQDPNVEIIREEEIPTDTGESLSPQEQAEAEQFRAELEDQIREVGEEEQQKKAA